MGRLGPSPALGVAVGTAARHGAQAGGSWEPVRGAGQLPLSANLNLHLIYAPPRASVCFQISFLFLKIQLNLRVRAGDGGVCSDRSRWSRAMGQGPTRA